MKAPMQFLDKNVRKTLPKSCENMSPPQSPPNCLNNTTSHSYSHNKGNGTSELLKWIAEVTIKRRQIRRKFRCSNLLAEAVLSNSIKEAKRELAQKQDEKRRNLQNFHYNYNLTVTCSPLQNSNNNSVNVDSHNNSNVGQDVAGDQVVQNFVSSLNSFFDELREIKS